MYNLLFDGEYRVRCATAMAVNLDDGRFRDTLIDIALNDDQIEVLRNQTSIESRLFKTSCAAVKRLADDDILQFSPSQLYNLFAGTLLDRNCN